MNLTLSQRGDYVVRSAIDLARSWPDGYRKVREIAEAMDLPRSFTPRVLGDLVKAGLAIARAGRAGGYRLARPPRAISLLDVVEAAEGPLKRDRCALRGGPCHWDHVCALHPAWAGASDAMRSFLAGITLADVAAVDQALAAGSYPTPPN